MKKRKFISKGHLIDSGILAQILNLIVAEGADYEIVEFTVGKTNARESHLEIDLICETEEQIQKISSQLVHIGCYEKQAPEAVFNISTGDKCVPEDFYSTTNHRTEVFYSGKWNSVKYQRMDAVIIAGKEGPECIKLRDVKKGDKVLCSTESVRVFPPARERESDDFGFMSGDVSSERSADFTVEKIAAELIKMKENREKVVVVAGPVVVHSGGGKALAALIREGFIGGLLAGNAIAVHDMESVFFGTSLGVCQKSGKPAYEGHKNHMRAINRINHCGSIKNAVEQQVLESGIMYEVIKSGIPYCLAGSIRDDGPLPETVTDMIEAQGEYAEIIKDASMVLMLSSMLHSIGTGNMMPSWVKTICIDINPAVVTKLADRGSGQAIGIVSDVGLFLRAVAARCIGDFK
ncbi:MAG: TIGR00300 family protein [Spirochaetia bacterium]|jgi:lysine-ketoglutarate reductase/saccharopine dehydrogenase-like protein (TIGR00300 family)|nr:TIGR00300 family protein [Spirochaetia bacterium]